MYLHPDDIAGAEVCFLLVVEWFGMKYRFSTVPIDLEDLITGQQYRYNGGLSDPDIQQSSNFTGVNLEADSVSVELVFDSINWVNEWLSGHSLVNSKCTMSMIPIKDGVTSFKEQDAIQLFNGVVVDPIIGTPDKPKGHVIFSIENSTNVVKQKLLPDQQEINVFRFPGLDQRAASLGRTISYPMGKYVPFVFGEPGRWYRQDTKTVGGLVERAVVRFEDQAQVSPAYTVDATGSGASLETTYVIAVGDVASNRVRVWDQDGGNFVNTVEKATNSDGLIVSQVKYQLGSVIEDNSFIPGLDNDQTFWVSWGEYDGGMPDPITGESLGPAINLILYTLQLTGLEYNKDKWLGLSSLLSRYQFAGYVNDPNVLAMDWLRENVLNHLPIQVFNGDKGLEPRVNLYHYADNIEPSYYLTDSGTFNIITGIQPLDVEIVNKIILKFCYAGEFQQYLTTFVIDPTLPDEELDAIHTRDPISDISFQRYGLREEVVECPFIWDLDTAMRVARDKIRMRGLGMLAVEVSAAASFGYLQVGDLIALTSENLSLVQHKCQIIEKSWNQNTWRFVLHLESNSIVNPRQLI